MREYTITPDQIWKGLLATQKAKKGVVQVSQCVNLEPVDGDFYVLHEYVTDLFRGDPVGPTPPGSPGVWTDHDGDNWIDHARSFIEYAYWMDHSTTIPAIGGSLWFDHNNPDLHDDYYVGNQTDNWITDNGDAWNVEGAYGIDLWKDNDNDTWKDFAEIAAITNTAAFTDDDGDIWDDSATVFGPYDKFIDEKV